MLHLFFNYDPNITIYLEKARPRSKALHNTEDHIGFMHYFKYFRLRQDNIAAIRSDYCVKIITCQAANMNCKIGLAKATIRD